MSTPKTSHAPRSPGSAARHARWALVAEFVPDLPDGLDTVRGNAAACSPAPTHRHRPRRVQERTGPGDGRRVSEQAVYTATAEVRRGRTNLLIAHRLSTIRTADLIVVLDARPVTETGNYDDLTGQPGAFTRLVATERDGNTER